MELETTEPVPMHEAYAGFTLTAVREHRPDGDAVEHLVVELRGEAAIVPLVRVNSACLTSEVFGCGRCDCAWQLTYAAVAIRARGRGAIVYHPRHEGRGAGLFVKIAAMAHTDRGVSSRAAFESLGAAPDTRDFTASGVLLARLGYDVVDVLTNNPAKIAALEAAGLTLRDRIEIVSSEESLQPYLTDKARDFGHLLGTAP